MSAPIENTMTLKFIVSPRCNISLIARNPTIAAVTRAIIADIETPLFKLSSPINVAPQLAGTLMRKLNRSASFLLKPLKIRMEIVVADLLMPGRIERPCTNPDKIASLRLT
tara:strand:+ start:127 stop:459 length:333 start_codon:yes stop_codon:yes gene_type:complete